jgi:hypothetical protein
MRALTDCSEETARSGRRRGGCHQRYALGPHGRNVNVLVRDGQLSAGRRQSKRKRLVRLHRSGCVSLVLIINFRLWAFAQSEQKVFDSSDENLVVERNDVAPTRDFQIWVSLLNHHGPKYILIRLRLLRVLVNDILELQWTRLTRRPVGLAHAVHGSENNLVDVPVVHEICLLVHDVLDESVRVSDHLWCQVESRTQVTHSSRSQVHHLHEEHAQSFEGAHVATRGHVHVVVYHATKAFRESLTARDPSARRGDPSQWSRKRRKGARRCASRR